MNDRLNEIIEKINTQNIDYVKKYKRYFLLAIVAFIALMLFFDPSIDKNKTDKISSSYDTSINKEKFAQSPNELVKSNQYIKSNLIWNTDGLEESEVKSMSFLYAKKCYQNTLFSPDDADFPTSNSSIIDLFEDSIATVVSYVDSKTLTAVKIRKNWYAKVKWLGGDIQDYNNWFLIECRSFK